MANQDVKRLGPNNRKGFIGRFCSAASSHPEAIAFEVVEKEQKWTYAQMLDLMEQFRAAFEKLEIEEGEMIMVLLPSCPEFIASIYALTSLSMISIPTNYSLTDHEMGKILEDAKPVGIVTNLEIYSAYLRRLKEQKGIRFILNIDQPPKEMIPEKPLTVFLSDFDSRRSTLEPPSDNPIVTCHYTYKGVGYPLGTLHRYHNYSFCLQGLEQRYPQDSGAVCLLALPLHPIYGIMLMVFYPLSRGCRLVMAERITDHNLVELLERFNVRATCLVPLLVPKFLVAAKARGKKANLRLHPELEIGSTATYLHAETIGAVAHATGIEITQGFGLTEALAVTATCGDVEHRGTLGTPICKETEVKVVDAIGNEVSPGQTGEIVMNGPSVAQGFLRKPAENRRFFKNGCFYTGDLGYKDHKGVLHFAGRASAIAKVGAQMVDLREVEQVLALHPAVTKSKVVVRGQMDKRNYISASVVVPKKIEVTPRELRKYCGSMLSRHKVPTEVRICRPKPSLFYDT